MFRARINIIFWTMATILLMVIFSPVFGSIELSFYFTAMLLPVIIGTSWIFNYQLVPHYLLKKRYRSFLIYFVYLLIVSMYMEMWAIIGAFIYLANYKYENLTPVASNIFVLAIVMYFLVFAKGFLLLIKRSFAMRKRSRYLRAENNKFRKGALTVRTKRKQAKILYDNILYIESLGDYVKIVTRSANPVITHERISHLAEKLPAPFIRIHRSFIVNSQKVDFFSKTDLQVNDVTLPISRTYKKEAMRHLAQNEY